MTILCLIALYCGCKKVSLVDGAQKGPFKLSNTRFMGPAYLDYYGKYYGFIIEHSAKDLEDAADCGNQMRANNERSATFQLQVPKIYETPQEIVKNYFIFSKSKGEAVPLIKWKLNMDLGWEERFRYIDPITNQWIVFDRSVNKFKVKKVPYSYVLESDLFTIRAI
jgi:hypothetical protein